MAIKFDENRQYYSPNIVQSYFVFYSLIDYLKNKGERWKFNNDEYDDLEILNKEINKI